MAESTYISLFSGAGSLDLGIRLADPAARCLCYVEREAHASRGTGGSHGRKSPG